MGLCRGRDVGAYFQEVWILTWCCKSRSCLIISLIYHSRCAISSDCRHSSCNIDDRYHNPVVKKLLVCKDFNHCWFSLNGKWQWKRNRPISQIPWCTCPISHKKHHSEQKCAHSVLNGALLDMGVVHCGICQLGQLLRKKSFWRNNDVFNTLFTVFIRHEVRYACCCLLCTKMLISNLVMSLWQWDMSSWRPLHELPTILVPAYSVKYPMIHVAQQ